jgi:hypothetical protein
MKTLILMFSVVVSSCSLIPQNITNSNGTGGMFIIKDASNNYFTLDQITGLLNLLRGMRLENRVDLNSGVIYNGNDRFLHTDGSYNTALRQLSFFSKSTGFENTAVGVYSLFSSITGTKNTTVGVKSLYSNTKGAGNTALEHNTGSTLIEGADVIGIGWDAQPLSINASYEITLGNQYISELHCAERQA